MSVTVGKIRRKMIWMWRDMFQRRYPNLDLCAGQVRVLCFHGVCPDGVPYINGRFMHSTTFRNLLRYLKEHAHILSPEDWHEKKWNTQRMNVLLTFDDGYANNMEFALPILEELDLPALWFVTGKTDFLHMDLFDIAADACLDLHALAGVLHCDAANLWKLKQQLVMAKAEQVERATEILIGLTAPVRVHYEVFWKLLSNEDLARIGVHRLIRLGNHTHTHFCLTTQAPEIVEREVESVDRRMIEAGIAPSGFLAVPYGIVNNPVLEFLQKRKKWCIFVNEVSPEMQGLTYERLTVNPFISLKNQVYAIYNGYY